MAAANGNKVVPYLLVLPSPPPSPSPPLSPSPLSPPFSPNQHHKNDRTNRKRNNAGWLPATNCCCFLSILGALLLAALIVASVAILLVITLSASETEMSSTTSTILTTVILNTTTETSTTSTSVTMTTTTSIFTTTLTTFTTTTTDTPCLPTCNSQQTCVKGVCTGIGYLSITLTWSRKGDGDIVMTTPKNKLIYWDNRGPSNLTDQGELDVDNRNGTGPENIFWSNSGSVPPNGTYYVCLSQYDFNPNASSLYPITAAVKLCAQQIQH